MALDFDGNVYISGAFTGTIDFNPAGGVFNLTSSSQDIFVFKLNTDGAFVWANKMGGNNYEAGNSIRLDAAANVYTTGYYRSFNADFDAAAGSFILNGTGGNYVFVSKTDNNGNFLWAKSVGSGLSDNAFAVSANQSAVYVSGFFVGSGDFDPSSAIFNLASNGANDIFILKLSDSGDFEWVKGISGSLDDHGFELETDAAGNVYTSGFYSDIVDFDSGTQTSYLVSEGLHDVFICKLDFSGNFLWAKSIGSTSYDRAEAMSIDDQGNVFASGLFSGTVDFDSGPGTFTLSPGGTFLLELDSSGNFISAQTANFSINSIFADGSGALCLTGFYSGTVDFDEGAGVANLTAKGLSDALILKLGHSTVGLMETNSSKPEIYPNPSHGLFSFLLPAEFSNCRVNLYITMGEMNYEKHLSESSTFIDISGYSPGIYQLVISG